MTPQLPTDLGPILRHLEAAYPNEGCGLILQSAEGGFRIRLMANAYDRYHAKDPERFPRTSATAYLFDPKEQLEVYEEADSRGEQIRCIFHSHVEVGAYFSKEDRDMAAPDGQPLFLDVAYLVVAVNRGKAEAARVFWWKNGDFAESEVLLK